MSLAAEPRPSRRIPWSMIGIAGGVAALLMLFFLASRVVAGDAFAFDGRILLALRRPDGTPVGSAKFASAVRDVTALGGATVLTMVVMFAAALLASLRRWRSAALVMVGTGLGCAANSGLKHLVARTRPDLVPHLMQETSSSFPSGHAAHSAIVYLTLATLAFPIVRGRATRGVIVGTAALLVAAIGASRVYLGVHWPSDVLAGWTFGALWAVAWWRVEIRVLGR
ncbi:hypothetical protein ASG37_01510 [Sphingomonas sp. Leaf407]|uniref:phosphatase PAP2 family protein n=1 Tax=unclassified Sphingomonas TaxID=196159 RepID=UPI0006F67A14|nr:MULTISPECIES: phosphatase PAP2 family protein [unclassified Sphingomonas]KQN40502.1 hypothetical protein ASE97_01535 [Sphingomonas sp. Leaf42]KQT29856.1 hypothetical protein ASG37_01510 [Sphingomonas sp. Leaf407]